MQLRTLITVAFCFVFASTANAEKTSTGLSWEKSPEGILVTEGDQPVLFYQLADKSLEGKLARAHYVHPLYALDGEVLTEDFPADHRHHRGVFWAWHQLIVDGRMIGDGWAIRDFSWDVRRADPSLDDDGSLVLDLLVHWKSPQWRNAKEAVVIEETSIRINPREQDRRQIDFDIRLRATQPETLIGGSDDSKGYGGFSLRLKLPSDIRFTSQNGSQLPDKNAVPASPWMAMSGSLGDGTSDSDHASSVVVLCHPDSAGYPPPWILREQRSMQNAVWPGREPAALSVDDPIRLRYRLVIHRDEVSADVIQRWQQTYARSE